MEALSLLKYWRASPAANVRNPTTTITVETDDDDDDEGPFFDLEFAVPDDEDDDEDEDEDDQENRDADEQGDGSEETDGEREFDLAVSSGTSQERTDPNLTLSPSDDLFFKGRLVPLEPSSLAFNPSEPNSKPQFPVSLLKSATKFRIFLLGFKKPKPTAETNGATPPPKQQQQQQQSKLFTVKFKVDEVPIVSLFTRDNSSRNSGSKNQQQQQQQQQTVEDVVSDEGMSASDAKRFAKDVVHKYLKMIKPLYVKVSRKYGEKLRFSGQLSLGSGKTSPTANNEGVAAAQGEVESMPPAAAAAAAAATTTSTSTSTTTPAPPAAPTNISKNQKQGNLPAGLRVVCKHLGKSRSASAAVAAVAPSPLQAQQRRDDSLFQQQDGIQSAIAHCKRSFNASNKEVEERSLPRSVSDTSADKSGDVCLTSSGKGKEACI
ncbi:probable membrane-associated kinase regulator 2 [Magnolia sinica]|uniref:probable membrane-associated kinase regulator 2 n=1 Tax=Magnolia sinica TaxID=86752 RepID=UPI002658A684|nr:probable membrane-associated kinase regulator 2 [Magnolia sinica]